MDFAGLKVMGARLVPWDGCWGVAVDYERGKHGAYPVGSREEAEKELRRLTEGLCDQAEHK
jgi:hypothetical protein